MPCQHSRDGSTRVKTLEPKKGGADGRVKQGLVRMNVERYMYVYVYMIDMIAQL